MALIELLLFLLLLLLVGAIVWIAWLWHKLRAEQLRGIILTMDKEDWRNLLIHRLNSNIHTQLEERFEQLKQKSYSMKETSKEDCDAIREHLFVIYKNPVRNWKERYPALTDLDHFVMLLLGMGLDNVEVALLLKMEKKTMYRRRQLIAQRMGISSLELDDFCKKEVF